MVFPRVSFSLAQFLLLVSLAAILISAGILLWQPSGDPEYWASAVEFSPDGKTLAASLYVYHSVQIWNPTPRVLGADASQSFSLLRLPDLNREKLLERTTRPGTISVRWPVRKMGLGHSLAFSPDGTMLATKGMENIVSIWDVDSGDKDRDYSPADNLSGAVSWADDETLVASATSSCHVLRANAPAIQIFTSQRSIGSVVLSRDGGKLATADDDGRIELWDVRSAVRLHVLAAVGDCFDRVSLAISPNGQFIAGGILIVKNGSGHVAARVWDTATGQERYTWDMPSAVRAVAFSPDGTTLAVAGGDKQLRLFSLNGKADDAIHNDDAVIAAIGYSPDGKLLATGDSRGQVRLWDVATKEMLREVQLHDALAIPNWFVLIIASLIWFVSWRYVRRKERLRLSLDN